MRSLVISAIALAFIGTVSAKISVGFCDPEIKQMTFDEYEDVDADVVAKPYAQGLAAWDESTRALVDSIEAWGFKLPFRIACEQPGVASPWKEIAEAQKAIADDDDAEQDYADGVEFSFYNEDVFNQFYN
jgi:hypothetical protein